MKMGRPEHGGRGAMACGQGGDSSPEAEVGLHTWCLGTEPHCISVLSPQIPAPGPSPGVLPCCTSGGFSDVTCCAFLQSQAHCPLGGISSPPPPGHLEYEGRRHPSGGLRTLRDACLLWARSPCCTMASLKAMLTPPQEPPPRAVKKSMHVLWGLDRPLWRGPFFSFHSEKPVRSN